MKAIHAIWKDGQIIPIQAVDWPEGTTLNVEPIEEPLQIEPEEELLGNDAASIARWIALYDSLPALQMTVSEETEWQDARRAMKDHTVARMLDLSIEVNVG